MAGDSQHGTIRRKLIEFLEPALPGIEVEVGTAERWQRMCLRFRHPSFEELLPEQRFRQVLAAIPQDYHQQHLQGAVWFEMAPGETEDDLLKAPRSEDLADREAAIAGTLFACGFFEALSKAMGESPIESCTGRFAACRTALEGTGITGDAQRDACLIFIRQGAYCDCEVLLAAQPTLADGYDRQRNPR